MSRKPQAKGSKNTKPAKKMDKNLEAEIKELFRLFDKNNDKYISSKELGCAMRYLGMGPTQDQINDAMKTLDKNGNGRIEYSEFLEFMRKELEDNPDVVNQEPSLQAAFKVFDKNGDGFIEVKELRHAMKELGEALTDQELEDMMKEADVDGDGRINYNEFIRIWCQPAPSTK